MESFTVRVSIDNTVTLRKLEKKFGKANVVVKGSDGNPIAGWDRKKEENAQRLRDDIARNDGVLQAQVC